MKQLVFAAFFSIIGFSGCSSVSGPDLNRTFTRTATGTIDMIIEYERDPYANDPHESCQVRLDGYRWTDKFHTIACKKFRIGDKVFLIEKFQKIKNKNEIFLAKSQIVKVQN